MVRFAIITKVKEKTMQYILNQPQTSLQLINWLKQHPVERVYQLTPFFKGVTRYTSPLCIKTSKSIYHHGAMVEAALQSASSLEELPPDVIMFFPDYATLHAAFTVAKEKWTIEQAIEYIGTAADKEDTFFQYLHPADRLRLPKVDDVLYPYYHWYPMKTPTDGYSVTSAHFPYIGNRPIRQHKSHSDATTLTILQERADQVGRYAASVRDEAGRLNLKVNMPNLMARCYGVNDDEDEDL